jgi:hypothetical protein
VEPFFDLTNYFYSKNIPRNFVPTFMLHHPLSGFLKVTLPNLFNVVSVWQEEKNKERPLNKGVWAF